jgi:hypothetical protein
MSDNIKKLESEIEKLRMLPNKNEILILTKIHALEEKIKRGIKR